MSSAVATTSVEAAAITTTSTVTTAAITTAAIASTTVTVATATIAVNSTVIASVAKADPYSAVSVGITIRIGIGIAIGVIRVRCGSVGDWRRIGLRLFGLNSTRVVSGLGTGIAIIGNLAVVAIVLAVCLGRVVVGVRPLNWS
jgi:hypothetical protein